MYNSKDTTTLGHLARKLETIVAGMINIVRPFVESLNDVMVAGDKSARPFLEKLRDFDPDRMTVPYIPENVQIIELEQEIQELM